MEEGVLHSPPPPLTALLLHLLPPSAHLAFFSPEILEAALGVVVVVCLAEVKMIDPQMIGE